MAKGDIEEDCDARKNVSFCVSIEEEAESEGVKLAPSVEFLDLVQIVSTILIPCFSRLVHSYHNSSGSDTHVGLDEPAGHDSTRNKTDTAQHPSLFSRLGNRFISYGRRKLQMADDTPSPFSDKEILAMARKALLEPIPGDDDPVVDETLVQLLLICHGEIERANNDELVKEMVELANSDSGFFDDQALVRAISSDLKAWNPTCEETPTTFFYDVFGVPLPTMKTRLVRSETQEEQFARSKSQEELFERSKSQEELFGRSKSQEELFGRTKSQEEENPQSPKVSSMHFGSPVDEGAATDSPGPSAAPPELSPRESESMVDKIKSTDAALTPETSDHGSNHKHKEPKANSAWTRCCEILFPIMVQMRRGDSDFSSAFLGLDMVIDATSSILIHIFIWVSYILRYVRLYLSNKSLPSLY